jgi:hypothetical protein
MSYTSDTAKDLIRLGGSIIVKHSSYTSDTLKDLARLAKTNGGHLTVDTAKCSITSDTAKDLIRLAPQNVTIIV